MLLKASAVIKAVQEWASMASVDEHKSPKVLLSSSHGVLVVKCWQSVMIYAASCARVESSSSAMLSFQSVLFRWTSLQCMILSF
jgi:hypothetical protein